jgi:hypothetical protein
MTVSFATKPARLLRSGWHHLEGYPAAPRLCWESPSNSWERRRLACPRQGFGTAKPLPYHPKHMDQQNLQAAVATIYVMFLSDKECGLQTRKKRHKWADPAVKNRCYDYRRDSCMGKNLYSCESARPDRSDRSDRSNAPTLQHSCATIHLRKPPSTVCSLRSTVYRLPTNTRSGHDDTACA